MILTEHQNNTGRKPGLARALSNPACLCLLLVAVTLAVYWPVMSCDFVNYDDPDYFSSNTHVQAGLTSDNVVWAFCTGHAGNWHPLTWLSLMLDRELSGPGPAGPHATNLLFHLANTVLLFLLLRCLTAATWRSAVVAALFALHPLHVESVAWISERKDVLSTFFGLLALLFYTRYAQRVTSSRRYVSLFYGLALLFFALGLMSKPMLVTLPFLMLLLDWWPLRREASVRSLAAEKIPFFVLSAISCVVTFMVQQKGGAVTALTRISLSQRLDNAFVSYARYLGKVFWPNPLANLYPYPGHWAAGLVVFSMVLVVGLSALAVLFARKFPFGFTGWFWFVGTLVPVIGLVQVGIQSMADRYTYLPLIGLFLVLVWGAGEACRHGTIPKSAAIFLAAVAIAACAWQTRDQIKYWQNGETLFRHAVAVTKNNYLAYNNLGAWLSKKGQLAEAMDCFHKSLQINPNDSDVFYNLGNVFAKLGDWDQAIDNYHHALQVTPNQPDVLDNLGFALAAKKQYADAIACFEAALKLNPDSVDAHNNLATVLFIQNRFDEAVRHFREALRITPDDPRIYVNLGDALVKQGQIAEAVRCYQEALRLKPGDQKIMAKLQALGAQISN
jgi:protein O-mannosyl-transferase